MEDAWEPVMPGSEISKASGEMASDKLLGPVTDLLSVIPVVFPAELLSPSIAPQCIDSHSVFLFSIGTMLIRKAPTCQNTWVPKLVLSTSVFVHTWRHIHVCICFCLCRLLLISFYGCEWVFVWAWLQPLFLLASLQPHNSYLSITISVFFILCNSTFPEWPVVNLEIK